jgi:hypothetical protein
MTPGRYRRSPMSILWILLATLAVSAVIAILVVRRNRMRAVRRLAEVPGPALRSTAASSLGLESQGDSPERGTGTLVLTESEVAFAQWHPDRLVRIPRPAISEVDTTRTHLGKTMKDDLLRIRWLTGDVEGHDAVALFVRDLDPWLTDLGGTRSAEDGGP